VRQNDLDGVMTNFLKGEATPEITFYECGKRPKTTDFMKCFNLFSDRTLWATKAVVDATQPYVLQVSGHPLARVITTHVLAHFAGDQAANAAKLAMGTQTLGALKATLGVQPDTALYDFFEAFENRQKRCDIRTFPSFEKVEKIKPTPSHPMLHESTSNLSTEERALCLKACRAAYDYDLVRRNMTHQKSNFQKWTAIDGAYDKAMVYHHNTETNTLYIGCRGSIKANNETPMTAMDWRHNFMCVRHDPKNWGINLGGEMHAGFLKKYASVQNNFYTEMKKLFDSMPVAQKQTLRIIVTGHSLGAAVAEIMFMDLCTNVLPQIYEGFDNAKQNKVWLVPFSSPCVATQATVDNIHAKMGQHNILPIQVAGDPVTLAGSTYMQEMLTSLDTKRLPALQELLKECAFVPPCVHLEEQSTQNAVATNIEGIKRIIGQNMELMITGPQTAIFAILKQVFAPVHGGTTFEDGSTGFNPDQFKNPGTLKLQPK